MVREARDKKQSYGQNSNPNKGGRNIQKESPHNPRANNPKYHQGRNAGDGGRKKGNFGVSNEYELPPIKPKGTQQAQPLTSLGQTTTVSSRKVIYAKSEQVQEALVHL